MYLLDGSPPGLPLHMLCLQQSYLAFSLHFVIQSDDDLSESTRLVRVEIVIFLGKVAGFLTDIGNLILSFLGVSFGLFKESSISDRI